MTSFCEHKPRHPQVEGAVDFYAEMLDDNQDVGIRRKANECFARMECCWVLLGKPYYNVHQPLADKFASATFEVPCALLKQPFPAFCIRLRESSFWLHDGSFLKTVLCGIIHGSDFPFLEMWIQTSTVYPGADGLHYVESSLPLRCETVHDCFERFLKHREEDPEASAIVNHDDSRRILGLTCSTMLAATGAADRLLEFDVLKRDIDEYRQSLSGDRRREIEGRAKRNGKHGWNVGGDGARLVIKPTATDELSSPTGRRLSFRHYRGAHWHAYHVGQGRSSLKVKWVDTTIVRPDLPMPEIKSRGRVPTVESSVSTQATAER